jgi:hypothetical protein
VARRAELIGKFDLNPEYINNTGVCLLLWMSQFMREGTRDIGDRSVDACQAVSSVLDTVARGIIILPERAHQCGRERPTAVWLRGERAAWRYRDDEEDLLICGFGVDVYGLR